ncbi:MAG: hypothetical protein AAB368_11740, partial [bacterium]
MSDVEIKGRWFGCLVAVMAVNEVSAMGTQPRAVPAASGTILEAGMPSRTVTGGTTDEAGHSASTTLTVFSITGRHLRTSAPQGIPGIWQVKLLEIVDSQGKVVKTVCEDTPRGVMRVFAAKEGQAYAVFEWDHRPGRGGAAAVLRYFDAAGDLKWSADICCGNTLPEFLVRMADDGSVVTIKDRTEGDACEIGEDYERVAKGCVGLRVFTSE